MSRGGVKMEREEGKVIAWEAVKLYVSGIKKQPIFTILFTIGLFSLPKVGVSFLMGMYGVNNPSSDVSVQIANGIGKATGGAVITLISNNIDENEGRNIVKINAQNRETIRRIKTVANFYGGK